MHIFLFSEIVSSVLEEFHATSLKSW